MITLESLPNEILLATFYYLNSIDLLRAFYALNSRFNNLLYKQHYDRCFIFDSIPKHIFDMVCQQHLPSMADRIISLHLNNEGGTPGQIDIFRSYIPSFSPFTHLRSLTFRFIHSYQMIMKIINECHQLANLMFLRFFCCRLKANNRNMQWIVDNIWSLSKLTHCTFDIHTVGQQSFNMPEKRSLSMEYLHMYIENRIEAYKIHYLIEQTPRLKHLTTYTQFNVDYNCASSTCPMMNELEMIINGSPTVDQMDRFLQSFPNLRRLNIYMWFTLIDGYQWEEIIHKYLLHLQVFILKMKSTVDDDENIDVITDALINSFRSSFWLQKHRWFVRCVTFNKTLFLHTLQNISVCGKETIPDTFKSTFPQDNVQKLYDAITDIYTQNFFDSIASSNIGFYNIKNLNIKMPINNQFWFVVSSLYRLKSLNISSYSVIYQDQLQGLFDRAPNLYYLNIHQDQPTSSYTSLFKCKSPSIRHICLRYYVRNHNYFFMKDDCRILVHTSLGRQCEKLSICVKNRENIIYLIEHLKNMFFLEVECEDDKYVQTSHGAENNDELIHWLKEQLSSKILITRDPSIGRTVRLWI